MKLLAHFILWFAWESSRSPLNPHLNRLPFVRSNHSAVAPPETLAPQPFHPGKADPAEMEARKENFGRVFGLGKTQAGMRRRLQLQKTLVELGRFRHETTVMVRTTKWWPVPFVLFGQTRPGCSRTNLSTGRQDLDRTTRPSNLEGHPPKTLDELYAEAKSWYTAPYPL